MKTQCPSCKAVQEIPKEYSGRSITCTRCGESFIAEKFIPLGGFSSQMPTFKLTGIGRETNRKRVRIYKACNLEEAVKMASRDGTIVDMSQTEIIPEIPATENQIRFAKELGLVFPENISKKAMTELLDNALKQKRYQRIDTKLPPTERQLEFMQEKGIDVPYNITRRELSDIIDKVIDEENEAALEIDEEID